ncbi:MAG: hypothetical protein HGA65_20905 [Oscillochloris sp.]|jgi:hypothetical protein|nr:hypothetical protein [Oscillochloris sp.]
MRIQLSTDHTITAGAALAEQVDTIMLAGFAHFSALITRVDVRLSNVNGDKDADPGAKHCLIVVDLAGLPPIEVGDHASTLDQAIAGATKKMTHMLDSTLSRLHSHP